jgi:two-component system, cell cycle response regulator
MLIENSAQLSKKPRILVIDDSRVMRKAISRILDSQFDLIETEDGEAGWEALLGDEAIDVIITDVEMPRLDGHALLTRIRSSEVARIREIPAIVITGAEDEPAKQKAYACGATDFVVKPIDGTQLLACMHTHLKSDHLSSKPAETAAALLTKEEANRDPLTQLYNRRFFMQHGEQDIAFAKHHSSQLSLIKLDIDNFKIIFGKYGDDTADNILAKLAQVLLAKIRQEDTAGRLAGTEFAVLLPSAQHVEAMVLAERLSAAVKAEIFEHDGVRIPITISMGVITWDDSIETIEKFLAQAEKHLRLAKGTGGNRLHTNAAKESAKSSDTPPSNADTVVKVNGEKPIPTPVRSLEPIVLQMPAMGDLAELASNTDTIVEINRKKPIPIPAPSLELTIDAALQMLANGDLAELESHLPTLTRRIVPLLDLCNKRLGLGLSFAIESLKEKLADYTD